MKSCSSTSALAAAEGGWGWLVVLGAAIVNMMVGMNYRIFGLVYLELRDKFQGSSTASVWVGGLNLLIGGFFGPVTAWLLQRYTHRRICLVATTMAVVGMTGTGFVPNLPLTYITYGVLLGSGISVVSTASVAMVGTYFDRRKGLALALQHSASGLSAFIFAPIMGHLMEEYSYSGTFLIFGGVFMNMYISAALFEPLDKNHQKSKSESSSPETTTETGEQKQCENNVKYSEKVEVKVNDEPPYHENRPVLIAEKYTDGSTRTQSTEDMEGSIITYSPSTKDNDPQDVRTNTNSEVIMIRKYSEDEEERPSQCQQCMAPFSKLQNPVYATFFLVVLAVSANRSVTSSFLPALAIEMGASYREASFLPAIGGITSVVSSIVVGALFDVPSIKGRRVYIYSSCVFFSGLSVMSMPLTQEFYFLIIPTVFNGGCSTIAFAQQMTVLADLLGKEHAVAGLGVARVALALGSIIGRTVSAIFVDFLTTNKLGFYTISGLPMAASIVFTVAVKWKEKFKVNSHMEK